MVIVGILALLGLVLFGFFVLKIIAGISEFSPLLGGFVLIAVVVVLAAVFL